MAPDTFGTVRAVTYMHDQRFFSAPRTGQRVDLVDTVNKLGPSLAQSASLRENDLDAFPPIYGGVV
jgi:hypothetical protein